MRKHLSTVDVNFIFNNDIFTEHGGPFHTHPSADGWSPAHYATIQPGMAADDWSFQNGWPFNADTCSANESNGVMNVNGSCMGYLRLIGLPSSITQFGPIVTLGPMRQPFPIVALWWTSTLPTIDPSLASFVKGFPLVMSALEPFCRNEFKYKHMPAIELIESSVSLIWW